jgi:hypothetical protein
MVLIDLDQVGRQDSSRELTGDENVDVTSLVYRTQPEWTNPLSAIIGM